MKLSTILAVTTVAQAQKSTETDVFEDLFEGSGVMDSQLTQDDKDFLSQCAMMCSDGACIMAEQRCDGKRHCVDGSDEHNCQVNDDSDSDNSKKRIGQQNIYSNRFGPSTGSSRAPMMPPMPAAAMPAAMANMHRFRGRFPTMSLSSTFKNFDDEAFERAQRKNRKMTAFVLDGQADARFDQMNKMLYYMSGGELNMADYQSYGCHCASGAGHGAPVDDIDSSCQRNNQCRSCTQIDWSSCQAQQAYFVNGWAPNNVDGIICVDQENTCSRALCECDLQLVKDIVASNNKWKRSRHLKFGFDIAGCNAESSAGLAARGLNHSPPSNNNSSSNTQSCCGNYPQRFPYSTGQKSCCGSVTYSPSVHECCSPGDIRSIGSC